MRPQIFRRRVLPLPAETSAFPSALARITPRTEMRIATVRAENADDKGSLAYVWICPCCGTQSAPWSEAPSVESAWAEHDLFAGRPKTRRPERDVFL